MSYIKNNSKSDINDSRIMLSVVDLDTSGSVDNVNQVPTGSTRLTLASSSTSVSVNSKTPIKPLVWMNKVIDKQQKHVGVNTFQGRVYNFLERPRTFWSIIYHCTSFLLLFACLTFSILSTMKDFADISTVALFWMEIGLVSFFGSEFVIRVWSAGCQGKFIGIWGRLRYMKNPTCVIDMIVVCASTYVILQGSRGQVFAASAIRGIRFLQLLRMIRIDRQGGTWRLLGSVVYSHRRELITTLYIGFLGLIFSSYFLYLAEKDDSESNEFASYADAIWWGLVTYTTIGYGDKVPKTWTGRAITCIFSLVIISFVTLPSGILGSGFALKVQQKQRHKQFSKQFPAAACLIQCAWRCYLIEKDNPSETTWRIYIRPSKTNSDKRHVTRLRRKFRSETSTPTPKKRTTKTYSAYDNYAVDDISIKDSFGSTSSVSVAPSSPGGDSVFEEPKIAYNLSVAEKTAVKAIRNMKLLVAKKNYLKSKKPYDVQDVIDQYSQGHINMMFSLRELQRKMEQMFGKTPAEETPSISIRLRRIEEKFHHIERRLDAIFEIMNHRHYE
ncbi:Potassium voltage-gated channel sub KQT member 1 [Chamberlinius hualienensis]